MQVTTANYANVLPHLPLNDMPEAVKKGVETINKYTGNGSDWTAYNSNETVKRIVNTIFTKLEPFATAEKKTAAPAPAAPKVKYARPVPQAATVKKAIQASKVSPSAKSEPAKKVDTIHQPKAQPKAAAPKKEKQPKAAKVQSGKGVEKISASVGFIKRFLNFNNKKVEKPKLISMLRSMQKAIVERVIRKGDAFEKELMDIQNFLVLAVGQKENYINVKLSDAKLEAFSAATGSEHKLPVVQLLSAYIRLIGKEGVKQKTKRLHERMAKALADGTVSKNDKRWQLYNSAMKWLHKYNIGEKTVVLADDADLNGLAGLGCCDMGTIYKIRQRLQRTKDGNYTDAKGRGAGSHHGGVKKKAV